MALDVWCSSSGNWSPPASGRCRIGVDRHTNFRIGCVPKQFVCGTLNRCLTKIKRLLPVPVSLLEVGRLGELEAWPCEADHQMTGRRKAGLQMTDSRATLI